ncbi:MAG TPA: hypothetical protein DDZ60_10315 [Planktothrix sp. UBA10369]|nr:hypothetical protein [Planktothrix sp. UBA10369]
MNVSELKTISEQLKSKGLDISPAALESSHALLIQQEIDLNPSVNDVVRLAILKVKSPQLSDYQLIELFLKNKQESLNSKSGYGDAIALNIEREIIEALEDSGIYDTIAENIEAYSIDAVSQRLSQKFNGNRFNSRLNALSQSNERFTNCSLKADENIIDAKYESLDDVINQCLPSGDQKLLGSGEIFRSDNNVEAKNAKKPHHLNGVGKGS